MRRAYQLTALALRSLAGALPATTGLVIGAGAGYLLWPHLLPEASAGVVLPFAVFGAVAGWLAFRIPLPKPVTHGSARFRSRRELDAFRWSGRVDCRAAPHSQTTSCYAMRDSARYSPSPPPGPARVPDKCEKSFEISAFVSIFALDGRISICYLLA